MLSIYAYFGFNLSAEERFSLIKKYFGGVALWRGADFRLDSGVAEHEQDSEIREKKIKVSYAHAPINMTAYLNNGHYYRKDTLKTYKLWIRGCKERGIPILVIHAENLTEYGIENLQELANFADEEGVKLAVENTPDSSFDELFEKVKNIYFCYDSCHAAMVGDLKGNMITKYASRLIATNLSDCDGKNDLHLLPGDGEIDWESVAKKLREVKYAGDYTLEAFAGFNDLDAEKFLQEGADRMKNIFAL
ncbi:MAG: sugar phosphate isomerase/epimerase [Clostridia bacterium]|nr:sugar phosphate isomerase/epimerase [Clostridia bacterium]